jgi:hypothetical protein
MKYITASEVRGVAAAGNPLDGDCGERKSHVTAHCASNPKNVLKK